MESRRKLRTRTEQTTTARTASSPDTARGQRRRPLARAARIGATTMAISGLIGRICHMILIHQALHTVAAIYEVVMKPQPEHDANMHASVFV